MRFIRYALIMTVVTFGVRCKHVREDSRMLGDEVTDSPQSLVLWNLSADKSQTETARNKFKGFVDSKSDMNAAAILRFFYIYPASIDDSVLKICENAAQSGGMKATADSCSYVAGLARKNFVGSDTTSLGPWVRWRSGNNLGVEGLNFNSSLDEATQGYPNFEMNRLLAESIVRPQELIAGKTDPSLAASRMLSFVDRSLATSPLVSKDLWRASIAKNFALANDGREYLSSRLNADSWTLLEGNFLAPYTDKRQAQIQSDLSPILDSLKAKGLVDSNQNLRQAYLSFLLPDTQIESASEAMDFEYRTDIRFFGIAAGNFKSLVKKSVDVGQPLTAVYVANLYKFSKNGPNTFSNYPFVSRELDHVKDLTADLSALSTSFHDKAASRLGCSNDNLIECGPLVSIYQHILPQLLDAMQNDVNQSNVQFDGCPKATNSEDPRCQNYRLYGLLNDKSAVKSLLLAEIKNPSSRLFNLAQFLATRKLTKLEDMSPDLYLIPESGNPIQKPSAMLGLCLAYLDDAGSSTFDNVDVPKIVADRIFLTSRLLNYAMDPSNSKVALQKFYERHSIAPLKSSYCDSDMALADPARAVQARIKQYVIDRPYFIL